jgi:hypothetical protein
MHSDPAAQAAGFVSGIACGTRRREARAASATSRDFAQIGCCDAKSGARRNFFSASAKALRNDADASSAP